MTTGPATPVLREALRTQPRQLALASALFIGHQAGEALVPVASGALIDRAVVTGDLGALLRWLAVLGVVFAVLSTSWRWGDRVFTASYERAAHELRLRVAARATAVEGTASRTSTGEVVSVASSDVDATMAVREVVAIYAATLVGIAVAAAALLAISPRLGLVVLVGMPPVLAVLQLLVAPLERRFSEQQEHVAKAAATATDLLRGLRNLKGLHIERNAADRYRQASRASLQASLRATRLRSAQRGLSVLVTGLFVALVALVGGHLAADDQITIGELIAAVGVTQFLVSPISRIGWAAAALGTARASAARIAEVLDAPPAVDDTPEAVPASGPVAGAIEMRDVHHERLHGFDLTIDPGRLVGIVSSQADSDAIVALLGRAVDPEAGALLVDGVAAAAMSLAHLRRSVLVAEHDAPLFTGTLAENLTVAQTAGDAYLHLLPEVAADEVAESLPHGLDTTITERGMSLSGGQRQRVALARCLIADPPVLVLHDPTTAIDSVTEARIATGLRRVRSGRTTIVLTTSPALLAEADEVVFIEAGVVTDVGTHTELMARNGAYAEAVIT